MANKTDFDNQIGSIGALQEFYFSCGKNNGLMAVKVEVLF